MRTYSLHEVSKKLGLPYSRVYNNARRLGIGHSYKGQYFLTTYNVEMLKRALEKEKARIGVYGGMAKGRLRTELERKKRESTEHNTKNR